MYYSPQTPCLGGTGLAEDQESCCGCESFSVFTVAVGNANVQREG